MKEDERVNGGTDRMGRAGGGAAALDDLLSSRRLP